MSLDLPDPKLIADCKSMVCMQNLLFLHKRATDDAKIEADKHWQEFVKAKGMAVEYEEWLTHSNRYCKMLAWLHAIRAEFSRRHITNRNHR